ncbi:MAG: hypothetical protein M1820_003046 [Bogoriella megaspora]|nr:MAG: hypothetical protein M1820_003046 [Bogoriella megaspora]
MVTDTFPAYRLSKEKIERFLEGIFGPSEYNVEFANDDFSFDIPRCLTDTEKGDLIKRRIK